ncbi:cation/H(+) antiporter 15 [Ricinus communis]|uniref:Na(+)/H(+) antiporter, putative n=1 Tax=Ricinus communis TaxID=3988 RepID=B9S141_RICCO|nr:cation/H(+) antiporter 15 [Ricinus communis]EEF42683.1 Na(+)/H(+) antiporter, putative [Ricinus communis]|eukprot:XP_002519710.1 cation/H(+) antiporter 15 [Ricinus communis]
MDINNPQNFYHVPENLPFHCYIVNITAEHGFWQSENPLTQALPLLAWQLAVVIMMNRILFYLLKPLAVPRIVTDILAGILLGPSALSKTHFFSVMFPLRSIYTVETVAYWALTLHLFMAGLEMDLYSFFRIGKKSIRFAIATILLPFILGICLYFIVTSSRAPSSFRKSGCIFWGAALTVTSYPVVARILADEKLLHSDIGRLATSISFINELFTWVLLSVLIPSRIGGLNALLSLVATAAFTAFCFIVVRPALTVLIRKTSSENKYSEYYLCFILVSVSFFSLVSDMLGTTSIIGAFVFGLIMPNRILASVLLEKFEDFVTAYLLPLFFASMGLRLNIWSITNWGLSLFVLVLCCGVKIVSSMLASYYFKLSRQDGFALGILLNTKSILAMLILHMGFDKSYLQVEDYVTMALAILLMTGAVSPIISSIYHPNKRLLQYKQRTIQNTRPDSEFRILTCLQSTGNVSGIINLLDSSNATTESPLCVFALHLVELTGRASAMLIVHSPGKKSRSSYSEKIVSSFETYSNLNELVAIQPLTALSPFSTMHEDICSLAEEKEVGFLILPFHKLPTPDGKLEDEGSTSFRGVNLNVLAHAPCTVGIFVDRGFGIHGESNLTMRQLAMLFIGGPDDREALSYAWRMSLSHGVSLTVVRFLPGEGGQQNIQEQEQVGDARKGAVSIEFLSRQRKLDDEFVNEFRLKSAGEQFMGYEEKIVNNDEDLIESLKEMHQIYDLYLVGRGEGMNSPLTAGLMDWCEYPELGALGDLLITSSFAQGSVMVIQQYAGYEEGDEEFGNRIAGSPDGSGHGGEQVRNWRSPSEDNDDGLEMEPFAQTKSKGHSHSRSRSHSHSHSHNHSHSHSDENV